MLSACGFLALVLLAPQSPDSLTLADALARAHRLRGDARVAAGITAEARAQLAFAGMVANPTAAYTYTGDAPTQHATLVQPLDWLAVRGANRSAARAGIVRAEADSILTAADIAAGVRLAYYGLLAAQEGRRYAEAASRIADSLRAIADRRFASGDISAFDAEQVALDAARTGQLVSRAREAEAVTAAALSRAIAWTGGPLPTASGALDDGLSGPGGPGAIVPDSLPLVRASVAESTLAASLAHSAELARIPMPALEAGVEWGDPSFPGKTFAVLGVSIPLPLWNQGGAPAAVARAQAAQADGRAAEARLEGARALAVAGAHLRETALRALVARDTLRPAATRLRIKATEAYRAGQTGVVALLDAARAEREVAAEVILELFGYQEAVAEWNRLLGVDR